MHVHSTPDNSNDISKITNVPLFTLNMGFGPVLSNVATCMYYIQIYI